MQIATASHFEIMRPGSFVTCIMALSESTEYSGGGTYFAHLDRTIHLQQVLSWYLLRWPYSLWLAVTANPSFQFVMRTYAVAG